MWNFLKKGCSCRWSAKFFLTKNVAKLRTSIWEEIMFTSSSFALVRSPVPLACRTVRLNGEVFWRRLYDKVSLRTNLTPLYQRMLVSSLVQISAVRLIKFFNVFSHCHYYLPLGKGVILHLNKLGYPLPKKKNIASTEIQFMTHVVWLYRLIAEVHVLLK